MMISSRLGFFFLFLFLFILYFTLQGCEILGKPTSFMWQPKTNFQERKLESQTRKELPDVAINPRVWNKYPKTSWRGLRLPVLVSAPIGRLGNVMGEYATLYALGRIYGATVRQLPNMNNQLEKIFPTITMPLLPGNFNQSDWEVISYLNYLNYAPSEVAASGIYGPGLFLIVGYPFEIQLFNTFRKDIMKEFTFSNDIQNKVRKFWDENLNSSTIVVGIHVRRTDYVHQMKIFQSPLPEDVYFKRATDYYRNKFPGVRFLVASDNMTYVRRAFASYDDVLYTPGTPRELDMALLASCNHSIITLGSFSFWTGYLTGGEVVYPDIQPREDFQFQRKWYETGQLDFFTPLPPF